MRAGPLRYFCELIRNVEIGRDGYNQPIYEESTIARFWAAKIHRREDEAFAATQFYATRLVTFRARYLADVRATDKIVSDGVTYDIKGVREVGYREGVEITAEFSE